MTIIKLSLFSILLCFVFPILSNADQLDDAKAAIENEDFKKAHNLLDSLVEENNVEAQNILGTMYIKGQGVEKDATKGLSLIMKAAKQGDGTARVNALSICSELAKQGDTAAMYNVGYMCLNDWAGEQDTNNCIKWLETAADYGHVRSANVLSRIYTKGMFGITPDKEKASYWNKVPKSFDDGINGKWTGTTPGPGGQPITLTFDFKAEGDSLTGTILGGMGNRMQIKDGKIDGNDISFAYDSAGFGGMKMSFKYTGVLSGNVLKLTYTMPGGPGGGGAPPPVSYIAKRVL